MEPALGEHRQTVVFVNAFERAESGLSQVWPVDAKLGHHFNRQADIEKSLVSTRCGGAGHLQLWIARLVEEHKKLVVVFLREEVVGE